MKQLMQMIAAFLGFPQHSQFAMAGGAWVMPKKDKAQLNSTLTFKGGKGSGSVVETPVYVPPPSAPAIEAAATQEAAVTPEEEAKRKKESTKMGAKSLQIPIVDAATGAPGQVGTGM